MKERDMVTIEILKKSQRSRPRKWVPIVSLIFLLISLVALLYYLVFLFPDLEISKSILKTLPAEDITIGDGAYPWPSALQLFFLPYGFVGLNLITLIICGKICNYRPIYWLLGWILVVAYIAEFLLTAFVSLYYFVPTIRDWLNNVLPAETLGMIVTIHVYVVIGMTAGLILLMVFFLFYNINYPGKYEAIYDLLKKRLKSFELYDDRLAYKKRFYTDYKYGRWISMMLDLHFESLERTSTKPMRKDAYDFMVYYACLCDSNVKRAIFDTYASEGRYYECRSIFHEVKQKSDAVDNDAKIIIPHYDPKKAMRKKPAKPDVPKRLPPLAPKSSKRPPDARVKTWSPEDI